MPDKDDGYWCPLWRGVLSAEHYHRLGMAVFVFFWFVDRTTEEYTDGQGERRGRVMGGRVVRLAEIAADFGISERWAKEHVSRLASEGYIEVRRAQYGLTIEVLKSKRWQPREVKHRSSLGTSEVKHPSPLAQSRRERSFHQKGTILPPEGNYASLLVGGDSLLGRSKTHEDTRGTQGGRRAENRAAGETASGSPDLAGLKTPNDQSSAGKVSGKPARKKPEPNPEVRAAMLALEAALGYVPQPYGGHSKAAAQLLKAGSDTEELMACFAWLRTDPYWESRPCGFVQVQTHLGEWRRHGRPKERVFEPASRNGRQTLTAAEGHEQTMAEWRAKYGDRYADAVDERCGIEGAQSNAPDAGERTRTD